VTVQPDFWSTAAMKTWGSVTAILTAAGFGSGVGFVKFLRHLPAPRNTDLWYGTIFDWLQDMVSNDRQGERRDPDGNIIWIVKPPKPTATPTQVSK